MRSLEHALHNIRPQDTCQFTSAQQINQLEAGGSNIVGGRVPPSAPSLATLALVLQGGSVTRRSAKTPWSSWSSPPFRISLACQASEASIGEPSFTCEGCPRYLSRRWAIPTPRFARVGASWRLGRSTSALRASILGGESPFRAIRRENARSNALRVIADLTGRNHPVNRNGDRIGRSPVCVVRWTHS
jgi:hypothetical protein